MTGAVTTTPNQNTSAQKIDPINPWALQGVTHINLDLDHELLGDVLQSIAAKKNSQLPLSQTCLLLEEITDSCVALIMRFDTAANTLHLVSAPSLSSQMRQLFTGITVHAGVGSCAASILNRDLVVVSDTLTDPNWLGAQELVRKTGVRACWSMPIFGADQNILGTISLSSLKPGAPDQTVIRNLTFCARLAAIALQFCGEPATPEE